MNVHGQKGVLPQDIHEEVQIHFYCGSPNPKIIHGQVQLTQDCPKQTDV